MESYNHYNELLQSEVFMGRIVLAFVMIVIIGVLILCLKYKLKNMATATVITGAAMILICCIFLIYPYQKDIDDNAYTVYTGEFCVTDRYTDKGGVYIMIKYPDQKKNVRYQLLCSDPFSDDETEYEGTLVYSERSKCIVDIILPES